MPDLIVRVVENTEWHIKVQNICNLMYINVHTDWEKVFFKKLFNLFI